MPLLAREKYKAGVCGIIAVGVLAVLIVAGSRNLAHFDAALVGYTFATLFATFGIVYRYAMWLQRPPTRLYWRRGWQVFARPQLLLRNLVVFAQRLGMDFAANRFIYRRGPLRWGAHWLIMWGCILAAAVTFPLVWGWVHFETVPGHMDTYQAYLFGFPGQQFKTDSLIGFVIFHALVWSALLVVGGVMLAFRRRMVDHGAAATQQFGEDVLPLLLLFAISITGLMLTASYTWMKGYGYDFLAILHAVTVILTLLWLPFGKFFHVFQRPAQLGVSFYRDAAQSGTQAECARCGTPYAGRIWIEDMKQVEKDLGFSYQIEIEGGGHYQDICPRCRRGLFGLAQGAIWSQHLSERAGEGKAESGLD